VTALVVTLAVVGVVTGLVDDRIAAAPPPPAWTTQLLLAVALTLAGRLTVAFRHRGEVDALDVFEAALTPAIALVPGLRLILLVAVAKLLAQLWLRMPSSKLAFNVAQWMACTGLASVTFAALSRPDAPMSHRVPALVAAMLVVAATNLAALALLFVLLPGGPAPGSVFQARQLVRSLVITTVTVGTGVATAIAAQQNRGVLFALFGLLLLLHWAGRGYALQGAHFDQRHWLQSATHTLSASVDPLQSAPTFLADVCRSCRAQAAELVLRRRGPVEMYRFGPGPGRPLSADLLDAELPAHVVALPRSAGWRSLASWLRRRAAAHDDPAAAALRSAGWTDWLAVPVVCDDARVGVLSVYDRTGLAELDASDLTVLQALAHELSSALQRAELIDEAVSAQDSVARIIARSNDGIVAIAEDGTIVAWNPALADMTGRAADEALGGPVSLLDARDVLGRHVPLEDWAAEVQLPVEFQIRAEDGTARWVSCSFAQDTDRAGGQLLVVMVRDVTELRRQRALLAGQAQIMELIASDEQPDTSLQAIARLVAGELDGATVGILSAGEGTAGRVLAVSRTAPSALPGDLTIPPDLWRQPARDRHPVVLEPAPGRDDARYWAMPVAEDEYSQARAVLIVRPTPGAQVDDHATEVLRTAARLTSVCLSREQARARLAHQASHDPLTGLPNRVLFLDRCATALATADRAGSPVVVLFVDLDQFKVVNDSLGHDVGDRLLVAVAERLRHAIRPADTIARFGGDEFTILCEDLDRDGAGVLAERLLAVFDSPFLMGDLEVFETASIGIAVATPSARPADLLQQADAAMYRAKDGGGNRYAYFDSRIRRRADARLASYTALRRAVDECQFKVRYQPMVRLQDESLAGMEALVRWQDARGRLLAPHEFIDLAEETGLIVPLGAFVLRTALLDLPQLSWVGANPARMSVNVSARQLTSPEFLPTVRRALEDSGVAPQRLSLEITESVLLTRSSAVYSVIDQLKKIGVGLSLDDFGTGHSSLDYLRLVPVDELKIDRRFVAEMTSNRESRAIVSAVIHLGHELGLRVVAEGIERAEQANCLADLGCDLAQGFYYSPPLPAEDVVGPDDGHRLPAPPVAR
jgi:diguanylate cyclase (GGDEF)-like protein/PAS domain S-box-containing protein